MTQSNAREEICRSTSAKLKAAGPTLAKLKATIGLDGFVDEIIAVVDKRHDHANFDPVATIEVLGKKILGASGQSSNYELVVKQIKLGGNGPIMANALASAGVDVTYIGNLGFPALHPAFNEFAERAKVISIGEPGHTDALEFEDGKLMFGKLQPLEDVNWKNLIERVGREKLKQLFDGSNLIGMVNWTMLPHMSVIWAKLLDEIIPGKPAQLRKLFVDLADPEKRTAADLVDAMKLLTKFQSHVDVILGLNMKESTQVLAALNLKSAGETDDATVKNTAAIREALQLSCVVVHPRRGAAAATSDGNAAWFSGPFVKEPKISTGAGDHFNAGFCLGRIIGCDLVESLCVGVSTSGYYVRTAHSPSAAELSKFVGELPPPQ